MSSTEYARWLAYDQVEPIGELGAWWRTGIVAATVANSAFGRKRRGAKPIQFMPILEQTQSPAQMRAVLEGMAARVAAKAEGRTQEAEGSHGDDREPGDQRAGADRGV